LADSGSSTMTNTIERVYAQALLEMAVAAKIQDLIGEQLQQLADLLAAEPDLGRLLSSRLLSRAERADSIQRMFDGHLDDLLYRFIQVINAKHRLDQLPGVARAYATLLDEHRDIEQVDAYVAAALPSHEAEEIASAIGAAISKHVVMRQHVEPSLIGGLKVRVRDQLYDGSVAAQLKMIRRRLIKAGREQARLHLSNIVKEEGV